MPLPPDDQLLASAARFLVDGGEEDATSVLLSCEMTVWESGDTWYVGDEVHSALHVSMTGPRVSYEILSQASHSVTQSIQKALVAVFPQDTYIKHFTARAELLDIDVDWRNELLEIARGRGVHNQGSGSTGTFGRIWNNLRFRSTSEVKVAQALDRAGVLYLPNCRARLGKEEVRRNREADFLICDNGKWGIVEVDGEPFHPPSRAVQDHERDRLFRLHGIAVVEHFDANRCYQEPDDVVTEFLNILRNG